jgi:hypothetical protein
LLDITIWNVLPQGEFEIIIYSKDQFDHYTNISLILYKDTLAPEITIIDPVNNQIFGVDAPNFFVNITDYFLNVKWYSLSNDGNKWSTNYEFIVNDGIIDQSIWSNLGNGTIFIRFYANDSAGNIGFKEVIVNKDIYAPMIEISSPEFYEVFGYLTPNFTIIRNAPNINTTWYTLDNGITNYTYTGTYGTINQSAWYNCEPGTVKIIFYINDTLNNIGFDTIYLIKDIYIPNIDIVQPFDDTIWDSPPPIWVYVTDSHLDSIWYKVGNDTIELPNSKVIYLNTSVWNSLPQGDFKLFIYASDVANNINYKYLLLTKDTLPPNITINNPVYNEEFGNYAPSFDISIVEDNLDTCWYTFDGGKTNVTFIGTTGQINQTLWENLWNSLSEGDSIILSFYANDTLGHLGYNEIKILKISEPSDKEKKEIEKPFDLIETITANMVILMIGLGTGIFGISLGISSSSKNVVLENIRGKRKITKLIILCLLFLSLVVLSAII